MGKVWVVCGKDMVGDTLLRGSWVTKITNAQCYNGGWGSFMHQKKGTNRHKQHMWISPKSVLLR